MTKNWGRWGDKDQIGTLNLLSADQVLRCCTEYVKTGRTIPLAHLISTSSTPNFPPRGGPVHLMAVDGATYSAGSVAKSGCEMSDDWIFMPTQTGTHLDALAHVWDDARLYNGFSRDLVRTTGGAKVCSVSSVPPLVGRGVLLDIAKSEGVARLPGDYRITGAKLAQVIEEQELRIEPGDIVLLRTGWMSMWREDPEQFREFCPGIDRTGGAFLADLDVAAIGADNQSVEAVPWDVIGTRQAAPVHLEVMRDCGIHFMELMNLDELAEAVTGPFLFIAAALPIRGAVGSPLAPVAIV
jgi:kynurenine formamidase